MCIFVPALGRVNDSIHAAVSIVGKPGKCAIKVKVSSHSYSRRLERGLTEVTGTPPEGEGESGSAAAAGARRIGGGEDCLPVLPADGPVSPSLAIGDVSAPYLGGTACKTSGSVSE